MDENLTVGDIADDAQQIETVDYSQPIGEISQTLSEIQSELSEIQADKDDSESLKVIEKELKSISGTVDEISANSVSTVDGDVDYSNQINGICQLLTYSNMLLIAVLLFAVVGAGIKVGGLVTSHLKAGE